MALRGAGKRVEVSVEDRRELERIVRASSSEVRMVERARIVVAASEGLTTAQIAQRVGCGERMVKKWRPRYSFVGLRGCGTRRGPGRR
jgi:transposase